jgi:hypothetical protein
MQVATGQNPVTTTAASDMLSLGGFIARRARDDLAWGEGAIVPLTAFSSDNDQRVLLEAVLSSIEPVADSELPYSACTDGRIPLKLLSGEIIPVREQVVGADIVSAFYVAEVLGASFYKDPAAPVYQRVTEVAEFLKETGLMPSSHLDCGAAGGFVTIAHNIVRFSADERFTARLQELLPADLYDPELYQQLIDGSKIRLDTDVYDGLSAETFLDAATKAGGQRAIAELKNDGRGVNGHVEEQIIRVRVPGYALNEAKVAELTGGREVFGVSDNRIEKIARLFGRGNDNDYKAAYMALEAFASASHGTLARNLPTWIVTSVTD